MHGAVRNKVQYNRYKRVLNKYGYHMDLKARIHGDNNTFVKILDNGNTDTILMSQIAKTKIKRLVKEISK